MRCPSCAHSESKVIDSRPSAENDSIRRRRECLSCQKRFTTYETIEIIPITVIKKDHSRESFDRSKLLRSIISACDKRNVTRSQMEEIAAGIESSLQNALRNEVTSAEIGDRVLAKMKTLDEVAYIRFASVYHQFRDIEDFMVELRRLTAERNTKN